MPTDLVILTAQFPYDGAESVLRWELQEIAPSFEHIYIVPSRAGSTSIALPRNALVAPVFGQHNWPSRRKYRALMGGDPAAVALETLAHPANWRGYAANSKIYGDILARGVLEAEILERWIRNHGLTSAIYYDYWFENSTLALTLLRRRDVIHAAVCRAHGFDVYDERWPGCQRVPFRDFKARWLDAIFPISKDGEDYLRRRLPARRHKIKASRLGVEPVGPAAPPPPENPRVVSCAALRPVKHVDSIPEILAAAAGRVSWTHFGDGSDRARVEAAARTLPSRIEWHLRGQVPNETVRAYYLTHPVSLLLSVSESEGIPVSMMEAQSAGIPIVALDVGAVREIVTDQTGILLEQTAEPLQIARAIAEAAAPGRFDRSRIRAAFKAKFDASVAYNEFARELLALTPPFEHRGPGHAS